MSQHFRILQLLPGCFKVQERRWGFWRDHKEYYVQGFQRARLFRAFEDARKYINATHREQVEPNYDPKWKVVQEVIY